MSTPVDKKPLVLPADVYQALCPLDQLIAQSLAQNGKVVIETKVQG